MDLKQLAQTNLSRAVRFDVNGETFQVTLREPVGLEAMDFLRDFRAVAEVSRRKEAADFTYQGDDPDNEARRNEVAEEMLEAMLTLVFAWAPRLCLEELTKEEVWNLIRLTGGVSSPISEAVTSMVGSLGLVANVTEDETEESQRELPFS